MFILILLGWLALIVGVILLLLGAARIYPGVRSGVACIIVGAVLLVLGYYLPAGSAVEYDRQATAQIR